MITSALITFASYIVSVIMLLFPISDGFPESFETAITTFAGYLANLSPILPFETLLQIIQLAIAFEIAYLTFRFARWAFSFIPLFGGRG